MSETNLHFVSFCSPSPSMQPHADCHEQGPSSTYRLVLLCLVLENRTVCVLNALRDIYIT